MKPYTGVSAAIVLTAICLILRPAKSTTQVKAITEEEQKHYAWLVGRSVEAYSIRVGMSRADLLKVFEPDGGLLQIKRYVLRSCDIIKVDVQFEFPKGTSPAKLPPDTELKISAISKPYLEPMFRD
jgi:hypothetical protein